MTQFTPNTMAGARASGRPNVYTLLLVIAFLALVVACVYVFVRHHTLFGSWNPFDLPQAIVGVVPMFRAGLLGG
jgi:hypothetical protein